MTVQELIDELSKLPPHLELWQHASYGTGVQAANPTPRIEVLCLHGSNGNPRYQSSLGYNRNGDKWTPAREVVAL